MSLGSSHSDSVSTVCSSTILLVLYRTAQNGYSGEQEGQWRKSHVLPLKKVVGFLVGSFSRLLQWWRSLRTLKGACVTIRQLPDPSSSSLEEGSYRLPRMHLASKCTRPWRPLFLPPWGPGKPRGSMDSLYIDSKGPAGQFRLHRILCAHPPGMHAHSSLTQSILNHFNVSLFLFSWVFLSFSFFFFKFLSFLGSKYDTFTSKCGDVSARGTPRKCLWKRHLLAHWGQTQPPQLLLETQTGWLPVRDSNQLEELA